jgi:hypothetical protein
VLRTAGAIKRRVKPGLGFKSCRTAWRTIDGYEAMNQLRKGQVQGTTKGDIRSQNEFIARLRLGCVVSRYSAQRAHYDISPLQPKSLQRNPNSRP